MRKPAMVDNSMGASPCVATSCNGFGLGKHASAYAYHGQNVFPYHKKGLSLASYIIKTTAYL